MWAAGGPARLGGGSEATAFGPDPYGGTRVGFSATTKINRKDFGIDTEPARPDHGAE